MRRGDIWTVAGSRTYAGKPRSVVVVQDDSFDATDSITIWAFTADETEAPLFRLLVEPNPYNGLRSACRLMVDKITAMPKSKIGSHIDRLDNADILRLNRTILVFLGLAASRETRRRPWAILERLSAPPLRYFMSPSKPLRGRSSKSAIPKRRLSL